MTVKNRKPGLKKPVNRTGYRPSSTRKRKARQQKKSSRRSFSGLLFLIVMAVSGLGGGGYLYWQSLYHDMPDLPGNVSLWQLNRETAIEFRDTKGRLIAVRGPRYGRAVKLSDLPTYVPHAFIAAEDKRFYMHDGADPLAVLRALWSNILSGKTVSGASTLTQQLVKNLILSPEQTLKRKAQEIRLARQLETRLSKDEILELYLNRIYFGANLYGLGAAARFYFDKNPKDLTLAEASLLAGLPKAPSRLALDSNMAGARARQRYVLSEMTKAGFMTAENARRTLDKEISLAVPAYEHDMHQTGFVLDMASEAAARHLTVIPEDMIVTLTIDTTLQKKISRSFNESLDKTQQTTRASQAAALVMNKDGAVLALYGGRDYTKSQFNRVTQARRQPGSAFKPFVYATALLQGLSPYDVFTDEPITIGEWTPQNFSGLHVGPVTIAQSLRDSLNTIAVVLTGKTGEKKVIDLAHRFGLRSDLRPFPSIALGSQEVTLWDITRAYGPFMTGGYRIEPYLVKRIETSRGKVLFEHHLPEAIRVYDGEQARLMTAMMADVIRNGTGRAAAIPEWSVAGKTGTSQLSRDAWFIGYSSRFLGGVWVGNDDDTPMKGVTGGTLPATLWAQMMRIAHDGYQPVELNGAHALVTLTSDQSARFVYYRALEHAFAEIIDP